MISRLGMLFVSSAMIGALIASTQAQTVMSQFLVQYGQPHQVGAVYCNGLTWHINRVPQPDKTLALSGPIWYENGSGMSFAQGTGQADGDFTLNVKKMSGKGPTGTITGKRMPDGSIDATAVGPDPCFAGQYHIAPGQTSVKG